MSLDIPGGDVQYVVGGGAMTGGGKVGPATGAEHSDEKVRGASLWWVGGAEHGMLFLIVQGY